MTLAGRSAARVSKNAVARLLAQVWAKLLSLALVAMVARYGSTAGLGHYLLVLTAAGFAGAASDVGLTTFLTREVAREGSATRQRTLVGTILPLKLALACVGLGGLVALGALAPFPAETKGLIPLGGLLLLPEAASGAMRAYINGRQRMEVSGVLDMGVRLLAVAGSFPALLGGFGVAGVLVSTLGAALVGVLLYAAVLRRWGMPPDWQWSPAAWRACLNESYPFALTSLAAMLYARADLVLLGLWRGALTAGWYGGAYRLWEAVGLLPASLLEALFPEMSRLGNSPEGRQRLQNLYHTASRAMLAGGLLLAVAGVLAASVLISLAYGTAGEYAPAVLPFRILLCGIPGMFLYLLSGHALYALGKQRQVTAVMLAIGVVNVSLNLVVIPRWSYVGAAGVALFTEWLLAAALIPLARRALAASEPGPRARERNADPAPGIPKERSDPP